MCVCVTLHAKEYLVLEAINRGFRPMGLLKPQQATQEGLVAWITKGWADRSGQNIVR